MGRLAGFYLMPVKVDLLGMAIASDPGIRPSSCYSRSFYCLPKSLRRLYNRSGSPLTHVLRYTDAARKEEKRWD